tara:strand:- start:1156 stop:1563 length:408 start_codon:yes stop_codon:yes gene_type:complete
MAKLCPNGGKPIAIDGYGNNICPEHTPSQKRHFREGGKIKTVRGNVPSAARLPAEDNGRRSAGGIMYCNYPGSQNLNYKSTCDDYNGETASQYYGGGCAKQFTKCLEGGGIPNYYKRHANTDKRKLVNMGLQEDR